MTLALTVPALISVLGDGASWIWDIVKDHFAGARELLDLWHGLERVGKASEVLYGRGSAEGQAWQKAVRGALEDRGLEVVAFDGPEGTWADAFSRLATALGRR